jgi:hypothetical protein
MLHCFFALQYGKLISYWHCRLVTISSAAPCDCVKQLLNTHTDDAKHSTATLKEKTEEIVLFYEPVQQTNTIVTICSVYTMAYIHIVPQTGAGSVFQPPRV